MDVIPFEKLEGAGNDFVLLQSPTPVPDAATIRRLLDRHHGIGGDGLLYLDRDASPPLAAQPQLDAVVHYWNADGGRAEYCGNGARCIAAVLLEGQPPGTEVRFRLADVVVRAHAVPDDPVALDDPLASRDSVAPRDRPAHRAPAAHDPPRFAVAHPAPRAIGCPPEIVALAPTMGLVRAPVAFDSGVPHLLLEVRDVRTFDLAHWGPLLRYHPAWGERGSNVDVLDVRRGRRRGGDPDHAGSADGAVTRADDAGSSDRPAGSAQDAASAADPRGAAAVVRVRTWERGVEGETLACGSGLLAVGDWVRTRSRREVPEETRPSSASGAGRAATTNASSDVAGQGGVAERGRVVLESASGARFEVYAAGGQVWLVGPARRVFVGTIVLPA